MDWKVTCERSSQRANARAGVPSGIGNREFTRGASLDNEKSDFPTGRFLTGDEEGAKWIFHRGSGICETRIHERKTHDQVRSDFLIEEGDHQENLWALRTSDRGLNSILTLWA
jgi:hypothetical protein